MGPRARPRQDVLAGAHAAVHPDFDLRAHRVGDGRHRRDRDMAPSSWRPPWLLTMSASAPLLAASWASSTSRMPLRMSLPPQRCLIHSTSSQLRRGSNCSAVQEDSEDRSLTPWRGRRCCRGAALGAQHAHAPARRRQVDQVAQRGLGRVDRPFLMSLWLTQDLGQRQHQRRAAGGLGASIRLPTNSRSRITYSWNQNGLPVAAATSSSEQMLMVDSVKGTPVGGGAWPPGSRRRRAACRSGRSARWPAAWPRHGRPAWCAASVLPCSPPRAGAAWGTPTGGGLGRQDLAVGVLHAGQAGRRDGQRHGPSWPASVVRSERPSMFTATRWRRSSEIALVGAVGALGPGARIGQSAARVSRLRKSSMHGDR